MTFDVDRGVLDVGDGRCLTSSSYRNVHVAYPTLFANIYIYDPNNARLRENQVCIAIIFKHMHEYSSIRMNIHASNIFTHTHAYSHIC